MPQLAHDEIHNDKHITYLFNKIKREHFIDPPTDISPLHMQIQTYKETHTETIKNTQKHTTMSGQ